MIKQEEPPLKSGAGCVKREFQARFRENVRVKFPCVTRLATRRRKKSEHPLSANKLQILLTHMPILKFATHLLLADTQERTELLKNKKIDITELLILNKSQLLKQ